jgi:hypothetical protein
MNVNMEDRDFMNDMEDVDVVDDAVQMANQSMQYFDSMHFDVLSHHSNANINVNANANIHKHTHASHTHPTRPSPVADAPKPSVAC